MGVSIQEKKKGELSFAFFCLAEWTGLEPATPGVTGRYSNRLNYHSIYFKRYKQSLKQFPIYRHFRKPASGSGGC